MSFDSRPGAEQLHLLPCCYSGANAFTGGGDASCTYPRADTEHSCANSGTSRGADTCTHSSTDASTDYRHTSPNAGTHSDSSIYSSADAYPDVLSRYQSCLPRVW